MHRMSAELEMASLWANFSRGDTHARERLLGLYYEEIRRIARRILNGDVGRMHIQPTDLVHEAVIKLLGSAPIQVRDQNHFLALTARVMRLTLIDEVRKHKASKRGQIVTLWDEAGSTAQPVEIDLFDETLDRLAQIEPEGARIVELRFYAGMTLPEIAVALSISESTVQRRWRIARAWILKETQANS
jgi:RNA polymerase sigma factor (TIGR02999 family)